MLEAFRRGRLLLLTATLMTATVVMGSTPATTRISDVVYRADGAPASGTVLISWPAFTTADNNPVAAGSKSVVLGPAGALSVDLVPNLGAMPAGTLYRVVYQTESGVTTEYWSVSTTSPTTIAAVRTTPGSGTASAIVSRQYVDTAVAGKANDTSVVHNSGNEIISGSKQFSAPPTVPTPLLATDAANKAYVDSSVANVGSGSYVSKAGDTMTGPLTLAGDPTSPTHATTRQYVDAGLAAKADRIAGRVPLSQLGLGAADSTKCLKGDQSWGACGTSSDAISLQGIPIDTATPTDGQVPTYDAAGGVYRPRAGGGIGLTPGMQSVKYTTDFSWTSTSGDDLSTPGAKTVSLAACPSGVKGSALEYDIRISGTGTPETVRVTGGTCAGNGSAGTLQFTSANAHAAGYTLGSASAGIREALEAAGTPNAKIVVPPNGSTGYDIYSLIIRSSRVELSGYGAQLNCYARSACIVNGDRLSSLSNRRNYIRGFRLRPMLNIPSVSVSQIARTASVSTITTAASHPFVVGDYVVILWTTDKSFYGLYQVRSVPSFTSFTVDGFGADVPATASTGSANLELAGIEDNANESTIDDVEFLANTGLERFNFGFVFDNDQGAEVHNAGNNGSGNVFRCDAIHCAPFIYSPGPFSLSAGQLGGAAIAYITNPQFSPQGYGNGILWQSGNALTVEGGVIQGQAQYAVAIGGRGGFPILTMSNVYGEAGASVNPLNSKLGSAMVLNWGARVYINGGSYGYNFGKLLDDGAGNYVGWYIVPTHSTLGNGVPLPVAWGRRNSTASVSVPWNRIQGASSYTLLRVDFGNGNLPLQGPNGTGAYAVATGLLPSSVCNGLVCSYTDTFATPANYTVPLSTPTVSYFPKLDMWPGPVVNSAPDDTNNAALLNPVIASRLAFPVVNVAPANQPNIYAFGQRDAVDGWETAPTLANTTSILTSGVPGSTSIRRGTAFILPAKRSQDGGTETNLKGAINGLCGSSCTKPYDYLTLDDSNPEKTVTHSSLRPLGDAADSALGMDTAGPYLRGPAITQYINSLGDNTSWKERLTASLKEFKTDVRINGNLTVTGTCTGCGSGGVGQTVNGDLTVTGKVVANSFESSGSAPFSIEGAYGNMTAAAANKSKLGFTTNGRLAVSENAGAVTEIAKKLPQEFTYTFFDANNLLTTSLQVPSIYVNRAAAFHIVEVYCEIDGGNASINLQKNDGSTRTNILSSNLACSPSGATATSFVSGTDAIGVTQKVDHVTASASGTLHRINVVVKYTVD